VKWLVIVLGIGILSMVTVLYTKSEAFCASFWRFGTVADDDGRARALRAIATAEGGIASSVALISSEPQSQSGREVNELWSVEVAGRKVKYDVQFFYIPGGPFCGPSFRNVSARGK